MKRLAKVKVKSVVRKPDKIELASRKLAASLAQWRRLGNEIKAALAAHHFERAAELSTPKRRLGEEILSELAEAIL